MEFRRNNTKIYMNFSWICFLENIAPKMSEVLRALADVYDTTVHELLLNSEESEPIIKMISNVTIAASYTIRHFSDCVEVPAMSRLIGKLWVFNRSAGSRFGNCFVEFRWFFVFFWLSKTYQAQPSHQQPWNSSETCLKSLDVVLTKFWEKIEDSLFERSKP